MVGEDSNRPKWYSLTLTPGVFPVEEIVAGYKNLFMSFPIADLWIAVCAFLSFKYLKSNDDEAILFGLLAGSGLIFLGLYAFLYGINTGLLFILTVDEIIEIGIKVYRPLGRSHALKKGLTNLISFPLLNRILMLIIRVIARLNGERDSRLKKS